MHIDWFTFAAQMFNFLILVWLLKRFLYKPILKTIDEREKRISDQLHNADELKNKALIEFDSYQKKNIEIDEKRDQLMDKILLEVETERLKLSEQSVNEINNLKIQLQEKLLKDQKALESGIRKGIQTEVLLIARKALSELATAKLEEQIAEVFISRLKSLDPNDKSLLNIEIAKPGNQVILRSTFELKEAQKLEILNFIKNDMLSETTVKFDIVSSQICGIELVSGGYKIVWSIDDYINSIEKQITVIISDNMEPFAKQAIK